MTTISISRPQLADVLRLASGIADRKSKMPMMTCVLLRASGFKLTVAATDLAVSLTAELACEARKPAAIALKADDISRFVSGATGDEVTIEIDERHAAEIRCGRSRFRIAGHPDRDFPRLPRQGEDAIKCDATALREMLDRASYAASRDESRGALTGVHLEVGATAKMYSTDGHRLSIVERESTMPKANVTICARGASELIRLLEGAEACRVSIDPKHIHVRVGETTMSAGLLDGQYPPVRQVIPTEHKSSTIVNRESLLQSLKRVSPLSNEYRGVTIEPRNGALQLTTADTEGQELTDEIDAEVDGGQIEFTVNVKYTIECLQHMVSDTVTLRVLDALSPIVFMDNDDIGIVMPMRG